MAATFKLFKHLLLLERRRLSGSILDLWLKDSRFESHLVNPLLLTVPIPGILR